MEDGRERDGTNPQEGRASPTGNGLKAAELGCGRASLARVPFAVAGLAAVEVWALPST